MDTNVEQVPPVVAQSQVVHPKNKKLKTTFIIVSAFILLASAVVGVWAVYNKRKDDQNKKAFACGYGVGKEAVMKGAQSASPLKIDDLISARNKIEQLPNYTSDPNCMYVVTRYYIEVGDVAKAKSSLQNLRLVYKPEDGFGEAIKYYSVPPEVLEDMIEATDKINESMRGNTQVFPKFQGQQ